MKDYSIEYEIEVDGVLLDVEVGISEDASFFEIYNSETGEGVAEGGLWFEVNDYEGLMVVDYDGVSVLPDHIIEALKGEGVDTSEI